ncbi:MAG TPA: CHAT domain-containing tetratricopeptide repeat protein [Verrucomicrobiae bacterium]|nr:CHAT domain-containing tetratricopeptide repeat protein [Verrucomicrobiae bacterium]
MYEEAVTLNMLGVIYLNLGGREKALDYFSQALPLRRATGDHAGEAATRNNIGAVYEASGEREKALEQFIETLEFERETGEQTVQAETLSYLGEVHIDLGQTQGALTDFEQALVLARQSGDQGELSPTLNNLAMAYDELGRKQLALDYYSQALAGERALNDLQRASRTLSNIGKVYDDLGDQPDALDHYGQALKIELQLHATNEEAGTRNNIASVYDELAQEKAALTFYRRALSLWRKLKNIDAEAKTLINIGFLYHNAGNDQKALTYYNQALPIVRGVGDRATLAMALHDIGVSEDRLGRMPEGFSNLAEGLLLFQEVQDPLGQGLTLGDLMSHSKSLGNPSSAIFFGKEAVNTYQQIRRNMTGLPNNLQKRFVASKENTYRELADLLITEGRLAEAEQVLDLLKEEEYFQFIRRNGDDASSRTAALGFAGEELPEARQLEQKSTAIATVRDEFEALRAKSPLTAEEEQRLATLSQKLIAATEDWERFCAGLDAELKVPTGVDPLSATENDRAGEIQNALRGLGSGTVALYTLVTEKKYYIMLITGSDRLARDYPIEATQLRRKVFAFRQALQNPAVDPKPMAQELYRILIGPIAGELEATQATNLMWSLDDVLRYIPISALHDGSSYLVSKYRVEVFTSESIPNLSKRPDVKSGQALGMGVSKAYGEFSALPSVPDELHRIVRDANSPESEGVLPGQRMLDETFTEDNVKKALRKNYPLVHIASHFNSNPGNDTNSFLLLGGVGSEGQHLTLAEIREDSEYDFTKIDLLTLSACDTAMSGKAGDGREVDSLGKLAQNKGARAVIASLWAVNDRSTGVLMQNFYRLWTTSSDLTKVEALRQAQLMMLNGTIESAEDSPSTSAKPGGETASTRGIHLNLPPVPASPYYSHPFYWAPFILMGNWQ